MYIWVPKDPIRAILSIDSCLVHVKVNSGNSQESSGHMINSESRVQIRVAQTMLVMSFPPLTRAKQYLWTGGLQTMS